MKNERVIKDFFKVGNVFYRAWIVSWQL